jgi:hypothetical protein
MAHEHLYTGQQYPGTGQQLGTFTPGNINQPINQPSSVERPTPGGAHNDRVTILRGLRQRIDQLGNVEGIQGIRNDVERLEQIETTNPR